MKTNIIRTGAEFGSAAISSTLLVLIPNCPICLAAYSTLFTAIGISASTLFWLRISLSLIMTASVLWLALRVIRQRNTVPALGLILGAVFVLAIWIIETPLFYNIGAIIFLSIMALRATSYRCGLSGSKRV